MYDLKSFLKYENKQELMLNKIILFFALFNVIYY
jgi:hypothetical protein